MRFKTILANLTLANQLTFLRLVAVPFFILAVLEGRFWLALALFAAAGLSDLADGLIARWFGQRTLLGSFLDPAADKLLLTAGFILLTDYPSMFQSIEMAARIPLWLTILTISAETAVTTNRLTIDYLAESNSWRTIFVEVHRTTIGYSSVSSGKTGRTGHTVQTRLTGSTRLAISTV